MFIASLTTAAQERFFEFLPGWKNMYIAEKDNKYYSFGTTSDGISLNHYQFSSFTLTGETIDAWEFDLDTISVLQSRYFNDVSNVQLSNYITGTFKGIESNRFYGTLIKFNGDFSDTLRLISFNILPGNGTQIRSHLSVNSNKFILGGYLLDIDFNLYPSFMETDSLGNIIWRKNFFCGSNCQLVPFHIAQASDGGYFYTCAEIHFSGGDVVADKTAIIKTDSLGNEQYRLHPGQPDLYAVRGWILPTDDGNYITAYSDPFMGVLDENPQVNPQSTIWLEKFDDIGNQIALNGYFDFLPKLPNQNGMLYYIRQMILSNDNNVIIVGYLDGVVDSGFILKVAQNGNPLWFRFITPLQSEGNDAGGEFTRIYGITQTTDGGYIMAGEYFSSPGNIYPAGIQTAIAVKVDEFGCLQPGCQIGDAVAELTKADLGLMVYPNPASETINISVSEKVRVEKVRVYEVMGRMVLDKRPFDSAQGDNAISKIQLDVSSLSTGMYLIEVETVDGFSEVKRILIAD